MENPDISHVISEKTSKSSANLKTVVITGFGPFGTVQENASWITVQHLNKLLSKEDGVQLIIEEIPVAYEVVSQRISQLWEEYKPELMVHVGVSRHASEITLEVKAHNYGYSKLDVKNKLPVSGCCIPDNEECIECRFDLEKICNEINQTRGNGASVVLSTNAGRFLCEFIYYTSLAIDCSRAIFIHVPPIGAPYSAEEMANCIKKIILLILKQNQTSE